jgi:hypothetical protein
MIDTPIYDGMVRALCSLSDDGARVTTLGSASEVDPGARSCREQLGGQLRWPGIEHRLVVTAPAYLAPPWCLRENRHG